MLRDVVGALEYIHDAWNRLDSMYAKYIRHPVEPLLSAWQKQQAVT